MLIVATACTPKDGGDLEPSTGVEPSTGSDSGGSETDAPPQPGSDTGGEPGSDTGDVPAPDTDSETATESGPGTDTGGEPEFEPPADCLAADPTVSSAFSVDLTGWPVSNNNILHAEAPCTIDSVGSAGGTVSTALSCVLDDVPLTTTVAIAAAPEGDVAWAAGDSVKLKIVLDHGITEDSLRHVQMRREDDSLLLSAEESELTDNSGGRYQPLAMKISVACTASWEWSGQAPMRLDFTPTDGPTVSIFHGHRGVVPISAEEEFAIDVEAALGSDIHHDEDIKILLRRVKP